jgi:hypothetical protein
VFAALLLTNLLGLHLLFSFKSGNATLLRFRLVFGPLLFCKAVFIFYTSLHAYGPKTPFPLHAC